MGAPPRRSGAAGSDRRRSPRPSSEHVRDRGREGAHEEEPAQREGKQRCFDGIEEAEEARGVAAELQTAPSVVARTAPRCQSPAARSPRRRDLGECVRDESDGRMA